MKRIALLLLIISLKADAQQILNIGIKEGIVGTRISGTYFNGIKKYGYVGGFYVNKVMSEKWTCQLEVLYEEDGSRDRLTLSQPISNPSEYYLQLTYIKIPLLFQYHIQNFSIEFGPGLGFLHKKFELIREANGVDSIGINPFKTYELNFNVGVKYVFSNRLGFNLRYTNSIASIRNYTSEVSHWYNPGQLNSVLALTATYDFESKKFRKRRH